MGVEQVVMQSPVGIIGYAFPEESFLAGQEEAPDAIAADGGSTDPGPYYLGAGHAHVSRAAVKRDIGIMLAGAMRRKTPLIIGSAGTAGGNPHVEWTRDIIRELAAEHGYRFRLAIITAEQGAQTLHRLLQAGRVDPLGKAAPMDAATIDRAARVVAMMGPEPIVQALQSGADVILCGRSSDAAIFAAYPIMKGFPPALAWHMGKILECGSAAAQPKLGSDGMLGIVRHDHFLVRPTNPAMYSTPLRAAAHSLYENGNPYHLAESPGVLDTSLCTYEAVDARTVKVKGSQFHPRPYSVKLEGAEMIGHRSVSIVGIRDPILIGQLESFFTQIRQTVANRRLFPEEQYQIVFHVYGRDGVMGSREPQPVPGHEVGVLIDVVAREPQAADAILALTRTFMQVSDFEGRLCTAGNTAYPFSPGGVYWGPAYRFSFHHVARPADPLELFPTTFEQFGG